jgi:hypothetical protein
MDSSVNIVWKFDGLGIELKTKSISSNLSNKAIERLLVNVVEAAKLVMEEAQD